MTTSIRSDLEELLWRDYVDEASFPEKRPLLAHYTSVDVFEKIISGNELWFSNPLYMNDWEELQFGMKSGAEAFRAHAAIIEACGDVEHHAKLIELFDYYFNSFSMNHAIDIYVLCFTEHEEDDNDGLLSMWRGYGAKGSGVALVFDTQNIESVDGSPLIVDKVYYGTKQERLDWINNKLDEIAQVLKSYPKTDQVLNDVAHTWIERLKLFSLFTKHKGFAEEKEWRVVYIRERDQNKALFSMLNYSISDRGVEPKLKLKMETIPGVIGGPVAIEQIVDRVILGPTISTNLASSSIQRLLEVAGKPALVNKVVASSIPFRS